jgi:DNA replication protein DnaC
MACAICHDTHWKSVEIDGIEQVVRCDCWRDALLDRLIVDAKIPRGYTHCELGNFDDYGLDSLKDAVRRSQSFVERFPVVDKGLLFRGAHGVGKTHLAVALLKSVIREKGARGYFFKSAELLKLVRDTYNASVDETEMEVLRPVLEADLLVLDDVGVEKTSEWVQETLGLVIDSRYSQRRPTIVTTNLTDSAKPDDFGSILYKLGPRTRSRLLEMCDWVYMEGYDIREVGRDPSHEDIGRWNSRMKELRDQIPDKTRGMAKARLKTGGGSADLKWSGGKAGS